MTKLGKFWTGAVAYVSLGVGAGLSVAGNRVSILAEHAQMSHDIDLEKARADLERAEQAGEQTDGAEEAVSAAWARARIRAVEQA